MMLQFMLEVPLISGIFVSCKQDEGTFYYINVCLCILWERFDTLRYFMFDCHKFSQGKFQKARLIFDYVEKEFTFYCENCFGNIDLYWERIDWYLHRENIEIHGRARF
jgi:hypothetical protein